MGRTQVAVIDPGPDVPEHVRALSSALAGADDVSILVTHGHADHAAAAPELARLLGVPIVGPEGVPGVDRIVGDGDSIETDEGALEAVHTPGHTTEHLCFLWPTRRALFAGDMVLGHGDTTWVAEYPGCVADYLRSIARLRTLDLDVIYPSHGPPLTDPGAALDRFEGHRRSRIEQVRSALLDHPFADLDTLLDAVYGETVPDAMRGPARRSLSALVEYVREGSIGR